MRHLLDNRLELRNLSRRGAPGAQSRCKTLQRLAHLIHLLCLIRCQRGNGRAVVGWVDDPAFGLELAQNLANDCAADAQELAKLALDQAPVRRYLSVDDRRT